MELQYFEYEITVSKGEVIENKTIGIKFITLETSQKFKEATDAIEALIMPNSLEEVTQELSTQIQNTENTVNQACTLGAIWGTDGNPRIDIDISKLEAVKSKMVELVMSAIDTLPAVEDLTLENKQSIITTHKIYDEQLSEEQKSEVTNIRTLMTAKEKLYELELEASYIAINSGDALLDQYGMVGIVGVTEENLADVNAAMKIEASDVELDKVAIQGVVDGVIEK